MKAIVAIAFAIFLIATVVLGQQPTQPPMHPHPPDAPGAQNAPQMPHPPPPQDPLAHLMFPPDMILNHASQLNLTDEQKTFMRSEVQKATASFQDLQWKLQDQMEALHDTMKSSSVNEQQALAQLDKVLDVEREINAALRKELYLIVSGLGLKYELIYDASNSDAVIYAKSQVDDITTTVKQALIEIAKKK